MSYSFSKIIPYKIIFKAELKYKHLFNQSLCSLTISVGQKNHEGSRFFSTLSQVNRHFRSCVIIICDTLQRHTLNISYGGSSDDLYDISEQEGESWLERNKTAIELLTIPCRIIRWNEWLACPKYQSKRATINTLYESDSNYKLCLNKTAESFLNRYKLKRPIINYEHAFNCSLEYLKEECAVMLMWVDLGINFEIYPSKRNLAMAATYDILIAPIYKNILIPIVLEVRSKKNQQIQNSQFKEAIFI